MCIIFAAYRSHPDYPLIIAANRDEFYARPTKEAHFWDDEPHLLAGRDLEQMGTWMGVTKTGRFAALTNYRNPNESRHDKKSRGQIVRDFLSSETAPEPFLQKLQQNRHHYQGFNLLLADQQSFYYYSNVENEIKKLEQGIYGLSNHLLDTPWPKVEKGKQRLKMLASKGMVIDEQQLFAILEDREFAQKEELPDTGVSSDWEKQLSSIFIDTPTYGTRCSTVVTIHQSGETNFIEKTFPTNKTKAFQFKIKQSL